MNRTFPVPALPQSTAGKMVPVSVSQGHQRSSCLCALVCCQPSHWVSKLLSPASQSPYYAERPILVLSHLSVVTWDGEDKAGRSVRHRTSQPGLLAPGQHRVLPMAVRSQRKERQSSPLTAHVTMIKEDPSGSAFRAICQPGLFPFYRSTN